MYMELVKPLSGGLGFSVVGPEEREPCGSWASSPGDPAGKRGPLRWEAEGVRSDLGHQRSTPGPDTGPAPWCPVPPPLPAPCLHHSSAAHWNHVETMELVNDGTGLGFGIVGGKTTGVIVKTILPGGVADQDGHLRSGDHILKIGGH
ncbi:hypothetical protein J4Q44_G00378520 [Coregonus suidteri]|uniref:PDZ domain-containing protein n=1 Tax=Coregonus suidteri TaxID=861788 RepID=A0AAN8KGL8_9TELE